MVSGGSVCEGISFQLAGAVAAVLASTAVILQAWRIEFRASLRTRSLRAMLREQLTVAISPVSTVFQGWVLGRMRDGVPPRQAMRTALISPGVLGAGQTRADPVQIALIALAGALVVILAGVTPQIVTLMVSLELRLRAWEGSAKPHAARGTTC